MMFSVSVNFCLFVIKYFFYQFKICATLVIVCAWVRYFIVYYFNNFGFILIPQFGLAILYPFFLNGMSKFVCIWFGDGQVSQIKNLFINYFFQRAIALSFCSLSMALGTVVGLVFGPFYIKNDDKIDFDKCR